MKVGASLAVRAPLLLLDGTASQAASNLPEQRPVASLGEGGTSFLRLIARCPMLPYERRRESGHGGRGGFGFDGDVCGPPCRATSKSGCSAVTSRVELRSLWGGVPAAGVRRSPRTPSTHRRSALPRTANSHLKMDRAGAAVGAAAPAARRVAIMRRVARRRRPRRRRRTSASVVRIYDVLRAAAQSSEMSAPQPQFDVPFTAAFCPLKSRLRTRIERNLWRRVTWRASAACWPQAGQRGRTYRAGIRSSAPKRHRRAWSAVFFAGWSAQPVLRGMRALIVVEGGHRRRSASSPRPRRSRSRSS